MSGKGDTPRPIFVDRKTYETNWERTFGSSSAILAELTKEAQEMGLYDIEAKNENVQRRKRK